LQPETESKQHQMISNAAAAIITDNASSQSLDILGGRKMSRQGICRATVRNHLQLKIQDAT